jgi:GTP-binding protein
LINVLAGEEGWFVFDLPGTTRDSVRVPVTRDDQDYLLIDTAGVRRRTKVDDFLEKFSIVKSLQAIEEANVVILVFDARAGISDQDATLAGIVEESGRAIVVAINKWDNLEPYQRQEVRRELDRKVPFVHPMKVFSSLLFMGVGGRSASGDLTSL